MNESNQFSRQVRRCAKVIPGARHTTDNAGSLSDNEVFSRPEFSDVGLPHIYSFGAGSAYPQGRQHGVIHVSKPSSTFWPRQPCGGFQSHNGEETMPTVNTTTTPSMGHVERQQGIENALSAALFHIRQSHTNESLWAATGRASRALTLLKQACTEMKNSAVSHE